jgi:putative tricarboxylic transport membrane protein
MSTWDALVMGMSAIADPSILVILLIGAMAGIFVGALPGIGPAVAISVALPITFSMSPLGGISLLLGIYNGSWYGGAVPAILINTPGTPSAVITTFDGAPMARNGQARRALALAFTSSFVGGILSVAVLILATPMLAELAKNFGAPEFLLALCFSLVLVCLALRDRMLEGIFMVVLGLFISSMGVESNTLTERFTFGITALYNGFPLVPVVVGLFGIAQGLVLLDRHFADAASPKVDAGSMKLRQYLEAFRHWRTLLRSTAIGVIVGALPGIGVETSGLYSYIAARRASRHPEQFGKGAPEGIVASETANNAVTGAAMVPVLALGIPGDAITALMLGVFMIHNIFPGPRLIIEQPELVSGIYASMLVLNLIIFALLILFTRQIARLSQIHPVILGVAILLLSFIGAYSVSNSIINVWIALGAGIFGYFARRLGFPVIGLMLGMILGPMIEERLRQSLSISNGNLSVLVERPISLVILLLIVAVLGTSIAGAFRRKKLP